MILWILVINLFAVVIGKGMGYETHEVAAILGINLGIISLFGAMLVFNIVKKLTKVVETVVPPEKVEQILLGEEDDSKSN